MASDNDRVVLSLKFNQDNGCFTSGMEGGLRIYNVDPLVELAHFDADTLGSIAICEMLYRTNMMALVSGGSKPKYPSNVVWVYDDLKKKVKLTIKFLSTVHAVRLRRNRFAIALRSQIYVYSFPNQIELLEIIDTGDNFLGLCGMTALSTSNRQILVYPAPKVGTLHILGLTTMQVGSSTTPTSLNAHKSELGCIALSQDGNFIATASRKGTLIRVWDSSTRSQIIELRRGSDQATIYCINFNNNADYLCCSSDKGTVHVFAIRETNLNRRLAVSNFGVLGNYGESQWGFTNFTIFSECACICAFTNENAIVAICVNGTYHKYTLNVDGTCTRKEFEMFLDICIDELHLP